MTTLASTPDLADTMLRFVVASAISDEARTRVAAARAALTAEFAHQYATRGVKPALDIRLPGDPGDPIASISATVASATAAVTDSDAFMSWVEKTIGADEIEVKFTVRPSTQAAILKNADLTPDGAVHHATGEIIPGVTVTPGGGLKSFSVGKLAANRARVLAYLDQHPELVAAALNDTNEEAAAITSEVA